MRYLALLVLCAAQVAQADIYVLRHAEKIDGDDPPLSETGLERAASVAKRLAPLNPAAVYSTDYQRTRQTAAAIADAAGTGVTIYDPRDPGTVVEKALGTTDHVVIVGHSNTVPALVHALGGMPGPDIDYSEYDRLYRLIPGDSSVDTVLLRSQPEHERFEAAALPVDASRVSNETLHFAMSLNGSDAGTSSWRYRFDEGALELAEVTQLEEYDTDARIDVRTDQTLAAGAMKMRGKMFGNDAHIDVTWTPDGFDGSSLMPRAPYRPAGEISLARERPQMASERSTALMLAHALDPDALPLTFRWYNTYDGQVHDIRAEVLGTETVDVPAGRFETYRLSYQGGAPSQVFYVTTTAPHRTVRIDIPTTPWRYELVRIEAHDAQGESGD